MKKVAVIILNWNGRKLLESYIPSLISNTDKTLASLYVADNGSDDDSVEFLTTTYPEINIIQFEKNWGFAQGYNLAVEAVSEEYVLLLNSDVEVTSNWLQPLVDFMDNSPDAGACQPKIRSLRNPKYFEHAGACGGFIDSLGYPFCRGRLFHIIEEDLGQYEEPISIFWATGAALLTRRSLYLELGGLDATFFAHMEEIDLCWRLNSRGYNIKVIPSSVVYHLGAATLEKESPRKTYLNFRNNLLMLYKNLPNEVCSKVLALRFFLDIVAAMKMAISLQIPNAISVVRAMYDFYTTKNKYRDIRYENLKLRTSKSEQGVHYRGSILYDFYLRGIRCYSQILFK
ncbi:MAG: glycosyltransferase family 2 protein [Bacteroidales bacterium]